MSLAGIRDSGHLAAIRTTMVSQLTSGLTSRIRLQRCILGNRCVLGKSEMNVDCLYHCKYNRLKSLRNGERFRYLNRTRSTNEGKERKRESGDGVKSVHPNGNCRSHNVSRKLLKSFIFCEKLAKFVNFFKNFIILSRLRKCHHGKDILEYQRNSRSQSSNDEWAFWIKILPDISENNWDLRSGFVDSIQRKNRDSRSDIRVDFSLFRWIVPQKAISSHGSNAWLPLLSAFTLERQWLNEEISGGLFYRICLKLLAERYLENENENETRQRHLPYFLK
jgi:hypothetical protein